MGPSLPQILIILFIVLILFGAGKLPKVMGDIAKGIKSFKQNLKDDNEDENSLENKKTSDKEIKDPDKEK